MCGNEMILTFSVCPCLSVASMSQICPAKVIRGPPGVPEGVPADDHLAAAEDGAPQGEGAVVNDGDVTQRHDGQVHGGGVAGHVEHIISPQVIPTPVHVIAQDEEGEGIVLGPQVSHRVQEEGFIEQL